MLIRSTWANGDVWRGKQGAGLESTRVRFILGKRKSKWKEQIQVEMESESSASELRPLDLWLTALDPRFPQPSATSSFWRSQRT